MRRDLISELPGPIRSVEIVPRKTLNTEEFLSAIARLTDKANMVTSPDNPMGGPGIDPVIATYLIASQSDMIPVPHITPRDRNRIQIQTEVLTALKLGIRNFFTISGDPIDPKHMSREVREVDTLGLIDCIRDSLKHLPDEMRAEMVSVGSALNPFRDQEGEIVRSKIARGSGFFISQVIFDSSYLKQDWVQRRNFKLLAGFMPLSRKGQIKFLDKMGSRISDESRKKLESAERIEEASSRIIKDAYDDLKGYVDGIHLMPLGKTDLAAEILECI
ncbi:MAG: methylenetetrahydrofolate reductase [Thermoplasmataceae archaeon]